MKAVRPDFTYAREHLRQIVERQTQGVEKMVEQLRAATGCGLEEGQRLFAFYRRHKLIRQARGTSYEWNVVHGGLLEPAAAKAALAEMRKAA